MEIGKTAPDTGYTKVEIRPDESALLLACIAHTLIDNALSEAEAEQVRLLEAQLLPLTLHSTEQPAPDGSHTESFNAKLAELTSWARREAPLEARRRSGTKKLPPASNEPSPTTPQT